MNDAVGCFFNQLHPFTAASREVYVDWQRRVGQDDVKDLLLTQLIMAQRATNPTFVLVTGQKGSGKTTELHRLREMLRAKNVFVSFEEGRFVEYLGSDITANDILYFAAERLVADLTAAKVTSAGAAWQGFWSSMTEPLKKLGVELKGPGGFGIGLSLQNEPSKRSEIRKLFDSQRSRFLDTLNNEIIEPAVQALREHNFEGITLLIDGLGDIPLRSIEDPLVTVRTNHEQIFIEQGEVLTGLKCNVVYTFPIELAYQGLRLGNNAGGLTQELGIIPIVKRNDEADPHGRAALREMLELRANHCDVLLDTIFEPADVERLIDVSGGHIRTLFLTAQEAITRAGLEPTLPIPRRIVEMAIVRRADLLQKGLLDVHREVLRQVHDDNQPPDDARRSRFIELLFSQHVLAYYDDRGTWYDAHPLTDPAMLT